MSETLIGRESELQQVSALVDAHRLVSVVGPGGVGKTTLVSAAVPGSYFARLAPLAAKDLRDSVAGSLRFASYDEMVGALEGDVVLVLDNCEHVIDEAAAIVEDLLGTHPDLHIVTTTREPLGLPGEQVVELAPLSTEGDPSPASELFTLRMSERGVEIPDDRSEIAELCERLDGLPLALELAAARTSGIAPGEMLEHLAGRLDLLGRSRPRGEERHWSITATVGWSFQLLEEELKEIFLVLSVFVGPFSARMAAALARLDVAEASDRLLRLVERSLVVHEPVDGESWYRLLSTIRAYGSEKLVASGRWDEMNERLVELAMAAADRLSSEAIGQSVPSAGPESARLFRVLRSAVEWCLEHDATPDRAKRLVAPLWSQEDSGFQGEAADLMARVIDHWDIQEAATLGQYAMVSRAAGRIEIAGEAAKRSLEAGGEGIELGYRVLGMNARARGEYADAIRLLTDGAAVAREHGHHGFAYELEAHRSLAMARAGNIDEATRSLARIAEDAKPYPMVSVLAPMFSALTIAGTDPDRAMSLLRQARRTAEEVGYTWAVNQTAQQMAVGDYVMGDTEAGLRGMADSLAYSSVQGSRSEVWMGLRAAAAMFSAAGRHDLAGSALLAARSQFGDPQLGPAEVAVLGRISTDPIETEGAPRLGVAELIHELRLLAGGVESVPGTAAHRFVRSGDVWDVAFSDRQALLAHTKGMADLHELIGRPGQEVSALDLMGAEVVSGDAGEVSDAKARRSYEQRIRELQADIESAEADNDPYRAEKAAAELDELIDHLSAAYGMGGGKRTAGDVAEKARTAVTWRIRSAIKKISSEVPALGDHLDRSIKTGRFCSYDPSHPVDWTLS